MQKRTYKQDIKNLNDKNRKNIILVIVGLILIAVGILNYLNHIESRFPLFSKILSLSISISNYINIFNVMGYIYSFHPSKISPNENIISVNYITILGIIFFISGCYLYGENSKEKRRLFNIKKSAEEKKILEDYSD